jgi:hypothetical protein
MKDTLKGQNIMYCYQKKVIKRKFYKKSFVVFISIEAFSTDHVNLTNRCHHGSGISKLVTSYETFSWKQINFEFLTHADIFVIFLLISKREPLGNMDIKNPPLCPPSVEVPQKRNAFCWVSVAPFPSPAADSLETTWRHFLSSVFSTFEAKFISNMR